MQNNDNNVETIKSVVFVNSPLDDESKDAIGIQSAIESIGNAIDDGAKMIGVIAGYGSGKSSLINGLKKRYENKKFIYVNMWSAIKDNKDENNVSNLTKTFLYQVALGINENLAKYISRLLSNNYRVFSVIVENSIITRCLIYIAVLYCISKANDNIIVWSFAFLFGVAAVIFGLYSSGVLYSFWKNDNERIVGFNELFEAYSIIRERICYKDDIFKKIKRKVTNRSDDKEQVFIVIDDLDRITDVDDVIEFLRELYRFNSLTLDIENKDNNPTYFILIKPESELYSEKQETNNENQIINDDGEKEYKREYAQEREEEQEKSDSTEKTGIYNKIFDYIIKLKPIHFEDTKTVLNNIINSEPQKKKYLFENILINDTVKNYEELPSSFDWLCKGNGLTIRELKERLNESIQLYIEIKNKAYSDKTVLRFRTCAAKTYLERAYERDFFNLLKLEDVLSNIIQESNVIVESNDPDKINSIISLIIDKTNCRDIADDLALMIYEGIIDADYRMYFYSFPKGSYVRDVYEKDLVNYIEMPNKFVFNKHFLDLSVSKVLKKGRFYKIDGLINNISRQNDKMFPQVLFYNKKLYRSMVGTNNRDKMMKSLMLYADWRNVNETVEILTNMLIKYLDNDWFFWDWYSEELIKKIQQNEEEYSYDKIIIIRLHLNKIFKNEIIIFKDLFVNNNKSSLKLPLITADELLYIKDKGVSIQLIDVDKVDDKSFHYIYENLFSKELTKDEMVGVIDIIKSYISKENNYQAATDICLFLKNSNNIDNVFFDYIKNAYKKGALKKELFCQYIDSVYEQLDNDMLEIINNLGIHDTYERPVVERLWSEGFYYMPLLYNYKMNSLQSIEYNVDTFDEENFINVCKIINSENSDIIILLRKANLINNNVVYDLYHYDFPFMTEDELELFNSFEECIKCIDGSKLSSDNIDIIAEYINADERMGVDCIHLFTYLFDSTKYPNTSCSDTVIAKLFIESLDYSKVFVAGLNDEDCEVIVGYISNLLNLKNDNAAINFMKMINRVIPSLEHRIYNGRGEDEYVSLINEIEYFSDDTINIITENRIEAAYNAAINKKLYSSDIYLYISSIVLGKDRFDYPMENVTFEDIYKHYNVNSSIFPYIKDNTNFLQDCIDSGVYSKFDWRTDWRLIKPLFKALQTVGFLKYVLKYRTDEEIGEYLSTLNVIKTEDDSVGISAVLRAEDNMKYLKEDKVFYLVKERLWENVDNVGYKRAFTRSRNQWLDKQSGGVMVN